jgi:hypothetical protein
MTRSLRIELTSDASGLVRFRPAQSFLGPEIFEAFRKATAGARYHRKERINAATLDKVPGILVRLREAGFDTSIAPILRDTLAKTTAQQWQDYQSAKDRLSAIDKDIQARHGDRLFPYQYTGSIWLTLRQGGAGLFDDQGTGKSRTILTSLPPNAPVLVVCPASVKSAWYGETEKVRPSLKPRVLEGRSSFRFPKPGEMVIVNYELLPEVHDTKGETERACTGYLDPEPCRGCKDELTADHTIRKTGHKSHCNGFLDPFPCPGCHPILETVPKGMVFVIDEAQNCKNSSAQRTVRARALGLATRTHGQGKTIVATGTPLENGPPELWSVLNVAGLAQEAFGDWATFTELFKGRKNEVNGRSYGYSWEDAPDDAVVDRLRRVSLRRTKADVQPDLPPKLYAERLVPVDRKALEFCDAFLREHGGADGIERLLASEVQFETMSKILSALAAAKVPALLKIVEDEYEAQGKPVLVFAMHRMPVELLGKKRGWETILGGSTDRGEIVNRFQDGKLRGLAATIQAAGTGITLTRTDTVLFLSRSFNPMQNLQAEDRIHRIGQTATTVHVVSLVADHPLDRRIAEITAKKMRMFQASVGASSVETREAVDLGSTDADREFEAYLRRIEDEVKGRPLPRLFAETEVERTTLEMLETREFALRTDEKLAAELAEEARAVGLSGPRWALACRLSDRALGVENTKAETVQVAVGLSQPSGEDAPAAVAGKDGMVDVEGAPHIVGCRAISTRHGDDCTCGSRDPEREPASTKRPKEEPVSDTDKPEKLDPAIVALLESARKMTADQRIDAMLVLITELKDEEREALFDECEEGFCLACGETTEEDEEHDCPYDDEDGDDDEEEEDEPATSAPPKRRTRS